MNTNKHESVDMRKLLDGVEVEWKALGEVANVLRGKRLTRKELSEAEEYPVFHGGLEPMGYYSQSNRPAQTVMVINVGASAGTVGFSPTKFWSSDGCFTIKHFPSLNNRFLYFVLVGFQHFLRSKVRVAGIPTLDAIIVEKLQIPIPPLSIQKEIVRILDAFTELTTELTNELTTELTNRKKQYNHYRDQLLSFEEGDVEWKTLGEISKVLRGKRLTKSLLSASEKYPVFHGGLEPLGFYHDFNRPANSVMVINVGASAGTVGYSAVDFWSSDGCFCIEHSERVKSRYLYYYLIGMQHLLRSKVRVAGIPTLDAVILEKLRIPIPPLAEQTRIVAILDKFDTLTHSISEGLPREIELRQKQYEHYRNLLLSFPKPESQKKGVA